MVSGDAQVYLELSQSLRAAWFNSWHPPFFPIVSHVLAAFGFGPLFQTSFLAAVTLMVLIAILQLAGAPRGLLLGAIVWFICDPALQLIRMTFWSENLFLLLCLLIAFALQSGAFGRSKIFIFALLTVCLILTRHAGLFLVPAIVISFALNMRLSVRDQFLAGAKLALVILVAMLAINRIRNGRVYSASSSRKECINMMVAFNSYPYCRWNPQISICEFDPDLRYISNPSRRSAGELVRIEIPDATLNPLWAWHEQRQQIGQNSDICSLSREILKTVVKHPFSLLVETGRRTLGQLGPWEKGLEEIQSPADEKNLPKLFFLQKLLFLYRPIAVGFPLILGLIGLTCICRRRLFSPAILFLTLGALSHAVGVAFFNPYEPLRYSYIPKFLILVGFILFLVRWKKLRMPQTAADPV